MSFITKLFDTTGYPARWNCGTWTGFEGYVHIFSDLGIWSAYFAIPVLLLVIFYKKKDIPLPRILLLFALFIVSCGSGHFVDAMMFYYPMYRFLGVVKLFTALVSWGTVIYLFTKIRFILSMLTPVEIKDKSIKQMADAMPQIVWAHDVQGKPIYFNERFYELTGADRSADNKEVWNPILFPGDREKIIEVSQTALISGEPFETEIRLKINGEFRWHLVRCRPVRENSHIESWVGTCTDIHNIKILEQNVEERTAQLMLTNKELEMFAYVASHDLQDPLRRMGAFLKIMFAKIPQTKETEEYKKIILEANENMKRMTSNLLEYARDANKVVDLKECDMHKVTTHVVDTLSHHIKVNDGKVEIKDMPKKVYCDETQIERVWQNLVRNSIKYRRKETPVIELGCVEQDERFKFYVKDNGEGIKAEDIEKLFVVFRRLRKDDKGVGFGLAICKKIVEKHGGEIWVESKKGVGSTFYFTLPKVDVSAIIATTHADGDEDDHKNYDASHLEGEEGITEEPPAPPKDDPKKPAGLPQT